jgi:hypothetical protein
MKVQRDDLLKCRTIFLEHTVGESESCNGANAGHTLRDFDIRFGWQDLVWRRQTEDFCVFCPERAPCDVQLIQGDSADVVIGVSGIVKTATIDAGCSGVLNL